MNPNRRGRPLGVAGKKRQQLMHPPSHIKARIVARGYKFDWQWVVVLKNMGEYHKMFEKFRQTHRLSDVKASVLLSGYEEEVPADLFDEILLNTHSWKRMGSNGGSKNASIKTQWKLHAEVELNKFEKHSANRAAMLMLSNWPDQNFKKPSQRSLRGFIAILRKYPGK